MTSLRLPGGRFDTSLKWEEPKPLLEFFSEAVRYIKEIMNRFQGRPNVYRQFKAILMAEENRDEDDQLSSDDLSRVNEVVSQVSNLFGDEQDLTRKFAFFITSAFVTPDESDDTVVSVPLSGFPIMNLNSEELKSLPKGSLDGAVNFIQEIKNRFQDQPEIFKKLIAIIVAFEEKKNDQLSSGDFSRERQIFLQVAELLRDHQDLIEIFRQYVLSTHMKHDAFNDEMPLRPPDGFSCMSLKRDEPKPLPKRFPEAVSYIQKIKNRFQDRPDVYKQFIAILAASRGNKDKDDQHSPDDLSKLMQVHSQLADLFGDQQDLIEGFTYLIPHFVTLQASDNPLKSVMHKLCHRKVNREGAAHGALSADHEYRNRKEETWSDTSSDSDETKLRSMSQQEIDKLKSDINSIKGDVRALFDLLTIIDSGEPEMDDSIQDIDFEGMRPSTLWKLQSRVTSCLQKMQRKKRSKKLMKKGHRTKHRTNSI